VRIRKLFLVRIKEADRNQLCLEAHVGDFLNATDADGLGRPSHKNFGGFRRALACL
jgi:hypothetical protein